MTKHADISKALAVLDLSEKVSINRIRRQYRKLALRYHPDRSGEGSEERLAEINSAYAILIEHAEQMELSFNREEDQAVSGDFWMKHFGDNM